MSRFDVLIAGLLAFGLHGAVITHLARMDTVAVETVPALTGELTVAPPDYAQMIAAWERPVYVAQSVSEQIPPRVDEMLDLVAPEPEAVIAAHESAKRVPPALIEPLDAIELPTFDEMAPSQERLEPGLTDLAQIPPPAIVPTPRPERREKTVQKAVTKPKTSTKPSPHKVLKSAASPPVKSVTNPAVKHGQGGVGSTTMSKSQMQSLISKWGASIRRNILRAQRYPRAAKGATGQVKLKLKVATNGSLESVSIVQSSGNRVFDQAALTAAKSARRFTRAPKGLTSPSYSFSISLNFRPN